MSSAPLKPKELLIERSWGGAFHIRIETPRLIIASATESDIVHYHKDLYGDADVMEKYSGSGLKDYWYAKCVMDTLTNIYKDGWPFSAMTVRLKDSSFIGSVTLLMIDSDPYRISLSYIFAKNHWNKGYAKEAVNAVVNYFASSLSVMPFYNYNGKDYDQPKKILASVSKSNLASIKILEDICRLSESEHNANFVCYEGEVSPPDSSRRWEILVSQKSMIVRERY